MGHYTLKNRNVKRYIENLYADGLQKSRYLNDSTVVELLERIGIFKFKGYVYAFRLDISRHTLDDVVLLFFFDKYLSRLLMDMTSGVETRLKSVLIETCYQYISKLSRSHPLKNNPFFYLISANYKNSHPKLYGPSVDNWKNKSSATQTEEYIHYGLYYHAKYDFPSNERNYLSSSPTLYLQNEVNYPPFHYFVESATLGTIKYLIKHLKIDGFDVMEHVAKKFGIFNPKVDFVSYLERLNEVRNRAAHRERLFNRSYRSVTHVGHYKHISQTIRDHGFMDVYLFLFFMLGKLDAHRYPTIELFKKEEIKRLCRSFKKDYYIRTDSFYLTKRMSRKEFEGICQFILKGME